MPAPTVEKIRRDLISSPSKNWSQKARPLSPALLLSAHHTENLNAAARRCPSRRRPSRSTAGDQQLLVAPTKPSRPPVQTQRPGPDRVPTRRRHLTQAWRKTVRSKHRRRSPSTFRPHRPTGASATKRSPRRPPTGDAVVARATLARCAGRRVPSRRRFTLIPARSLLRNGLGPSPSDRVRHRPARRDHPPGSGFRREQKSYRDFRVGS
jgi:hypothetical protein